MLYLYTYRSVNGKAMPALHKGTESDLRKEFQRSATPIIDITPLPKESVQAARDRFAARLKEVPAKQTGLRHSVESIIDELDAELTVGAESKSA